MILSNKYELLRRLDQFSEYDWTLRMIADKIYTLDVVGGL